MSTITKREPLGTRRRQLGVLALVPIAAVLGAWGAEQSVTGGQVAATSIAARGMPEHGDHDGHPAPQRLVSTAMRATAPYQDVEVAEAAGYASSIDSLGCFQSPERGGMGVHYIHGDLLDATVDVSHPEALVYELDASGAITGLVAHEYIVPIEAWTSRKPPKLFGMDFHQHPTLPLWVLHAWLWKSNPDGVFTDWNPAVRMCPAGVPIFGQDLPAQ